MFCTNCGTKINKKFCTKCGQMARTQSVQPLSKSPPVQSAQKPSYSPMRSAANTVSQPPSNKPKPSGLGKTLTAVGGIAAVIIVVTLVFSNLGSSDELVAPIAQAPAAPADTPADSPALEPIQEPPAEEPEPIPAPAEPAPAEVPPPAEPEPELEPPSIDLQMTEHRLTIETAQGYKFEFIVNLGDHIIRGSDTEKLNAAWNTVGGTDDMPSFGGSYEMVRLNSRSFTVPVEQFAFAFGYFRIVNLTPEGFPLINMADQIAINLTPTYVGWWASGTQDASFRGAVQFGNSTGLWTASNTSAAFGHISAGRQNEWRNWGPVPFVIAIGGATRGGGGDGVGSGNAAPAFMTPNFPDGNPELISSLQIMVWSPNMLMTVGQLQEGRDFLLHDLNGWYIGDE